MILDDAFQHRRAARDADVVLVDADSWSGAPRLLPAGPWREPLRSARRASLVIITRKTADKATVEATRRAVAAAAPHGSDRNGASHSGRSAEHVDWSNTSAARAARGRPDCDCRNRPTRIVLQTAHRTRCSGATAQLRRSSRIYEERSAASRGSGEQLRFCRLHSQRCGETGVHLACRRQGHYGMFHSV